MFPCKSSRLNPKLSLETYWGVLLLFDEGYRKHFFFFLGRREGPAGWGGTAQDGEWLAVGMLFLFQITAHFKRTAASLSRWLLCSVFCLVPHPTPASAPVLFLFYFWQKQFGRVLVSLHFNTSVNILKYFAKWNSCRLPSPMINTPRFPQTPILAARLEILTPNDELPYTRLQERGSMNRLKTRF